MNMDEEQVIQGQYKEEKLGVCLNQPLMDSWIVGKPVQIWLDRVKQRLIRSGNHNLLHRQERSM